MASWCQMDALKGVPSLPVPAAGRVSGVMRVKASPDGCSEFVEMETRLMFEKALEAETRDALGRTEALEEPAVGMPARDLSVHDIDDAFRADDGRLLPSRTTVDRPFVEERRWITATGRDFDVEYETTDTNRPASQPAGPPHDFHQFPHLPILIHRQ